MSNNINFGSGSSNYEDYWNSSNDSSSVNDDANLKNKENLSNDDTSESVKLVGNKCDKVFKEADFDFSSESLEQENEQTRSELEESSVNGQGITVKSEEIDNKTNDILEEVNESTAEILADRSEELLSDPKTIVIPEDKENRTLDLKALKNLQSEIPALNNLMNTHYMKDGKSVAVAFQNALNDRMKKDKLSQKEVEAFADRFLKENKIYKSPGVELTKQEYKQFRDSLVKYASVSVAVYNLKAFKQEQNQYRKESLDPRHFQISNSTASLSTNATTYKYPELSVHQFLILNPNIIALKVILSILSRAMISHKHAEKAQRDKDAKDLAELTEQKLAEKKIDNLKIDQRHLENAEAAIKKEDLNQDTLKQDQTETIVVTSTVVKWAKAVVESHSQLRYLHKITKFRAS